MSPSDKGPINTRDNSGRGIVLLNSYFMFRGKLYLIEKCNNYLT
jgi:hypothetical protein